MLTYECDRRKQHKRMVNAPAVIIASLMIGSLKWIGSQAKELRKSQSY
jgi:hypothetical protein